MESVNPCGSSRPSRVSRLRHTHSRSMSVLDDHPGFLVGERGFANLCATARLSACDVQLRACRSESDDACARVARRAIGKCCVHFPRAVRRRSRFLSSRPRRFTIQRHRPMVRADRAPLICPPPNHPTPPVVRRAVERARD